MSKLPAPYEERERLIKQIGEWNANRLDLFELSLPDQNLEFHGVMRFYHQDDGQRVSTKCIRVSSSATTYDVLSILIDKFRPDMRMLSLPSYALYEVHINGEERRLNEKEYPLIVQLNWGKDDREGRFLLKSENQKTVPIHSNQKINNETSVSSESGFKRKLSKREKKEQKKREKDSKIKGKENETPANNVSISKQLYNELPETSFTRSISNPEAVMKKRRELKLQRKLENIQAQHDNGGTLKIYGKSLKSEVPYKTLLLSTNDTVSYVIKESLDKYGLEREDPNNYVLIQEIFDEQSQRTYNHIMDDDECPLMIISSTQYPPDSITFEIRKRTPDMPPRRVTRHQQQSHFDNKLIQQPNVNKKLPFLREVEADGRDLKKGRDFLIKEGMTELGSSKPQQPIENYIRLYGVDVLPIHCVIMFSEQVASVTPQLPTSDVAIDNVRIHKTEMLRNFSILRVGKHNFFRFINPLECEEMDQHPQLASPTTLTNNRFSDGNQKQQVPSPNKYQQSTEKMVTPINDLPATLWHDDDIDKEFLRLVINEVKINDLNFKLAPTYTLYMAARFRITIDYKPELSLNQKKNLLSKFFLHVAGLIHRAIYSNEHNTPVLAFWMANCSELLHFIKHDGDISCLLSKAKEATEDAVQVTFRFLVNCIESELNIPLNAFFDPSEDIENVDMDRPQIGHVLQLLSSTMSLLRRCRVNAALTIQLFSQLFHFINYTLFNKLIAYPTYCTRLWGDRLRHRLALVESWAEKQGLELAAECHLGRIIQAAYLLSAPKYSPQDTAPISSACFKLNSLQIKTILTQYSSSNGEPPVSQQFISSVVRIAQSTADVQIHEEGRKLQVVEETELHLPFLLPDDGYTCQLLRGIPNGLGDLILPLIKNGMAKIIEHSPDPELWTVNFVSDSISQQPNMMQQSPNNQRSHESISMQKPLQKQQIQLKYDDGPEIEIMLITKLNGSLGLSIVAAQGEKQVNRGIYIKSVVENGAAFHDGRLRAGDQLLEVDGQSLIGLMQEKAAQLMTKTGNTVSLKVAKQAAAYHGLAALLSQPSPIMQRPPIQQTTKQQRPISQYDDNVKQNNRLQNQHQAVSSSNIQHGFMAPPPTDRFAKSPTIRSKSTSQLDQAENIEIQSNSRFDLPPRIAREDLHVRHSPDIRVAEWQQRNERYEKQQTPDEIPIEYKRSQQPHFYESTINPSLQPQRKSETNFPVPNTNSGPTKVADFRNNSGITKSNPSPPKSLTFSNQSMKQQNVLSPYGHQQARQNFQSRDNYPTKSYGYDVSPNSRHSGQISPTKMSDSNYYRDYPSPSAVSSSTVNESDMKFKTASSRSIEMHSPLKNVNTYEDKQQQQRFQRNYEQQQSNDFIFRRENPNSYNNTSNVSLPKDPYTENARSYSTQTSSEQQQPIYSTVNKNRNFNQNNFNVNSSPEGLPLPPPSTDHDLPPPPPPPQEYEHLMKNEKLQQKQLNNNNNISDDLNYQNLPVSRVQTEPINPQLPALKSRPPPTATKPKINDLERQRILRDFDKVALEKKGSCDQNDDDLDIRDTASGRASMLRMLKEQVNLKSDRFTSDSRQDDIERLRADHEVFEQQRLYNPSNEHERQPVSNYQGQNPTQRITSDSQINSFSSMGYVGGVNSGDSQGTLRTSNSMNAMRHQQPQLPEKKSVSFNSNLTEFTSPQDSSRRFTSSTSSDGGMNGPPSASFTSAADNVFAAAMGSHNQRYQIERRNDIRPPPQNQQYKHDDNFTVAPSTPGVVGAQEIYNDPRDKMLLTRPRNVTPGSNIPERLSFRDKMKMFASEIGENTPPERIRTSRTQYQMERNGLN